MPCLKNMHGSLRSGVNGAKGRFGPSCIALCVSFKNANCSKEGRAFGNMFKKIYSYLLLPDPLAIQSKA